MVHFGYLNPEIIFVRTVLLQGYNTAKPYFTGTYILLSFDLITALRGQRAKPIVVDPGLYMSKKQDIYWAGPERELPTAFKLFTGTTHFSIQTINFLHRSVMEKHSVPLCTSLDGYTFESVNIYYLNVP